MKVKEHDVRRGIVVRLKKSVFRFNGLRLSFSDNAIVLLDKKKNPLGNRIYGPLPYEIREKKLMKLVLMAPSVF
jgi:large subunit ribosomal protein L14